MFPNPKIGNFEIGWYSLILCFTLLLCSALLIFYLFRNYKQFEIGSAKLILFPIVLIAIGFIGARSLSVFEHLYTSKDNHTMPVILHMLFSGKGGLDFFGAPIFIIVTLPIFLKYYSYNFWLKFIDLLAPIWCLGYAMARLGCLISGDGCYGTWTTLPWGMYFPYGNAPNLLPVHPAPLYESIIHFLILILLFRLHSIRFNGQLFFIFIILTSVSRFFIEFVRINPKFLFNLTLAQIISIVFSFSAFIFYKYLSMYSKRKLTTN